MIPVSPTSQRHHALGFIFGGFLGLLHMEIVRERLEREFDLTLFPLPSVEYRLTLANGQAEYVDNPSDVPQSNSMSQIEEPYLLASVITPSSYTGTLMDLCQSRRGELVKMEYLYLSVLNFI